MIRIKFLILLLLITSTAFAQSQNLLSGKYTESALQEVLIPKNEWKPFPKITNREEWLKADQKMLTMIIGKAEEYIGYEWPYIPATKSLLIERTGDRDEYQRLSFKKREILGTMLLAEIAENRGRFIDPIINGVWSICEESWWGVPAHLPKTKELSGLMDVSKPFVDLFAAETGTFLAWVDYFLGDQFDAISPQIRKRIYQEVNYRLLEPLMNNHHGWMGKNANNRPPNNWNPWICSNWINTVLLLEPDEKKRTANVAKALKVLDEFVNPYPSDGGCDEGPSYWGAAAASLFDNISLLNLASNNAFEYVFDDIKIKEMGRFIYRAQISEKYFLNFADADPQPNMASTLIYRFGKAIKDEPMMLFGAYYRRDFSGSLGNFHFFRHLFSIFLQDEFQKAPMGLPLPKDVWLPILQVAAARDFEGSTDGFYMAAKGGHNDESHNHNDIGNFVIYYNGAPLLIDVGRGTYTSKTFSSKRYEIWYNCSNYHNLPTVNSMTQLPGGNYKAKWIKHNTTPACSEVSMDIAPAYPKEAGINSWKRTIRLNRGKGVVLKDQSELAFAQEITMHLMTCYPAEVDKPGKLTIHYNSNESQKTDFTIQYNPAQFEASIEKIELGSMEDVGIVQKWGDNIYRINFKATKPKKQDQYSLTITKK